MEVIQEDLLGDLESNLVPAHSGKKLTNFIIDRIVFYVFVYVLGIVLAIVDLNFALSLQYINPFVDAIVTMALFGIFMGCVEAIFKGRSVGKLITRPKAVNLDGSNISAATAFARGFSRAIPFEPFSALGSGYSNPWHDRWNKTLVIDLKASTIINQL